MKKLTITEQEILLQTAELMETSMEIEDGRMCTSLGKNIELAEKLAMFYNQYPHMLWSELEANHNFTTQGFHTDNLRHIRVMLILLFIEANS